MHPLGKPDEISHATRSLLSQMTVPENCPKSGWLLIQQENSSGSQA
jgi:hypothetical protein